MSMSKEHLHALVREVRKNPCLYANNTGDYKNHKLRLKAWTSISRAINFGERICAAKWRILRDRFVRETHRLDETGACESTCKWEYMQALSFLRPHLCPRSLLKSPSRPKFVLKAKPKLEEIVDHDEVPFEPVEFSKDSFETMHNEIEDITLEGMQPEYVYESCNVSRSSRASSRETSQQDSQYQQTAKKPKYENSARPVSGQKVTSAAPRIQPTKNSIDVEEHFVSFMDRMAQIQENRRMDTKRKSKHDAFFQLLGEKLDCLSEREQDDTKMHFLNYVHDQIRNQEITIEEQKFVAL